MMTFFRLTPMNLRRKIHFCLLMLLVFAQSSCLTDIRTSYMKTAAYDKHDAEKKAKIWIDTMMLSHQASTLDIWPTYTLTFSDEYFGFKGAFANPFNTKRTAMSLHYIPNSFDGRLDFADGRSWVLQSWKPFKKKKDTDFIGVKSKKIRFWLPTYQYFFELPNRIGKADIIRYAGEGYFEGRLHEKIFVSWDQEAPHYKADQYILWIDLITGRLSLVEFTLRDQLFARKALAVYRDYAFVEDYLMPHRIEIKSKTDQRKLLHEMQVYKLQINYKDATYIRIKENIEILGDKKL